MRNDARRRATFGVTIENTQMNFWFTCMAITLVSKPFNFFVVRSEHLIYFFCSLAFANDNELGWDPTIQRVCVGCTVRYDITVCTDEGDLVYQITRVISDFSADALTGCGTRVFETCLKLQDGKLVKTAEPVVWKDSRRDCNQDREDIIFKQIYADHQGTGNWSGLVRTGL
ncbi:hypothetical protein BKA83DRAFT_90115 [Pisolithus microcarpus]|nr:hypothetical protein BKA83DRAFT_90115 [Pisolithus microcarpus]